MSESLAEKVEQIRKRCPSNPGAVRPGWEGFADLYSAALVDIQTLLAAYDAQVQRTERAMEREKAAWGKLRALAEACRHLHSSLHKHVQYLPRSFRDRLAPTMDVLRRTSEAAEADTQVFVPGSPEEEAVFRAGWERGREDGIEEAAHIINTSGKSDTVGAAIARRIRKLLDAAESEIV